MESLEQAINEAIEKISKLSPGNSLNALENLVDKIAKIDTKLTPLVLMGSIRELIYPVNLYPVNQYKDGHNILDIHISSVGLIACDKYISDLNLSDNAKLNVFKKIYEEALRLRSEVGYDTESDAHLLSRLISEMNEKIKKLDGDNTGKISAADNFKTEETSVADNFKTERGDLFYGLSSTSIYNGYKIKFEGKSPDEFRDWDKPLDIAARINAYNGSVMYVIEKEIERIERGIKIYIPEKLNEKITEKYNYPLFEAYLRLGEANKKFNILSIYKETVKYYNMTDYHKFDFAELNNDIYNLTSQLLVKRGSK